MKKILIIDDERNIRRSLTTFLTMKQFKCHEASDGEEGLREFLTFRPDLILVDYRMPKISGIELIEKIKEADKTIPIILFSADKYLEGIAENCMANKVLKKPFSLIELLSSIKQLI